MALILTAREFPRWLSAPGDTIKDRIDGLASDPSHQDYLRPAKASLVAVGGAGGDLPTYVGALPPAGQPAWDWQQTWKARLAKTKTSEKSEKK